MPPASSCRATMKRFLHELRRRHVFRIAVMYAVAGWLAIQVAAVTFPNVGLPQWMITAVIVMTALGFPVAMVVAYAFELTPDGIRRMAPEVEGAAGERAGGDPDGGAAAAGARATAVPAESPTALPERSVAVLPFVNMSSDPENEYFSDGITEEILTGLTKVAGLRVAARTSSFAFKGKSVEVSEVATRLRVGSVLEGSVRRVGDRVRIAVQLVDGRSGFHLWSSSFDRDLTDIFAVQSAIAHEIARALRLRLSERERQALDRIPTADPEAYDLYLRGRFYFHRLRRVDLEYSAMLFRRATEIDPGYARAYAGLADTLALHHVWFDPRSRHLVEAAEAARRSMELQPDLAEAHVSLGHVLSLEGRYDEAAAEFGRALALDPLLFEALYLYGRACMAQGDLERASHYFGEAHRVRPDDYQSIALQLPAALKTGKESAARPIRESALRVLERHLELNPDDVRAVYFRAHVLAHAGRVEEAREAAEQALQMEPEDSGVSYNVACLEARLGNEERALALLERTVELGFLHYDWIRNDPDLDSLRRSPRFERILQRLRDESGDG